MWNMAPSRGILLWLLTGFMIQATGCASMSSPAPSQATPQAKPQGMPDRSPVAAGVIVIVTDQTGTLLGAIFLPNPVSEPITIKKEDLLKPEDLTNISPEKTFLAPGFQTITIFGMGDPCQYVNQGGKAVKKCW